MEIKYYEINEAQARRAQGMWSFSDYIEGSETDEYKKRVDEVYALGESAIQAGASEERVLYHCDRFARKYAEWKNRSFQIELQCPSIMIAGGSNFPVQKKEKQNAARDRHMELCNTIFGIKDKLHSMISGTELIKSDDEDAIERLQHKVEELAELQEEMKAANAWYRKHGTMTGYKEQTTEEAAAADAKIKNGYSWEQVPYPSYLLTNNNATLRNAKNRLERLTKVKSEPVTEMQYKHFKAVRNTEIMRLQLIFDGKPEEKVRKALKENGYKWSPTNNAWQRQLTNNALYSMKFIEQAFDDYPPQPTGRKDM